MIRSTLAAVLCTALAVSSWSCATSGPVGVMTDHFHWRGVESARGWAVFLPGSSGLTVFDDEQHYFTVAERLNQIGWSVLLVDYKPAYRAAADRPDVNTGEKIAWVTERAIDWIGREHPETANLPGAIVAWSLGAEGALLFDGARGTNADVTAVALYYPSNQGGVTLTDPPPMLILTGESDDVTTAEEVKRIAVDTNGSAIPQVALHTYPNAHHGFDIVSLRKKKTVRILPGIGPKATLQYHEDAAKDAELKLTAFFNEFASRL